jgi:hypothetical protein
MLLVFLTNLCSACIASVLSLYFRFRLYGSHDISVDDIPPMATK